MPITGSTTLLTPLPTTQPQPALVGAGGVAGGGGGGGGGVAGKVEGGGGGGGGGGGVKVGRKLSVHQLVAGEVVEGMMCVVVGKESVASKGVFKCLVRSLHLL